MNMEIKGMNWENQVVLVTGGTGSFGKKFIEIMLKEYHPKKIIVFSRDELKQYEMRESSFSDPSLRYFIGDVRDLRRLRRAFHGVDIAVHAAALKQVPACEYNPNEAIMTNIMGGGNVIEAALDMNVSKVMAISTDKAVNPVNLYGATKLAAEKLFVQSNVYAGGTGTRFACVRYGNVVGSRGSVVPVFIRQREQGVLTITDKRMTRFWLSLEQGVRFTIRCIEQMEGGEVFVPKIPSMRVIDLARAIAPDAEMEVIGIRPGEKIHEILVSEGDARHSVELEDMYVIEPTGVLWFGHEWKKRGTELPDGFVYASNTNDHWLSMEELEDLLRPFENKSA
jgi:UDP-N-acetylglucosamine 4,6-dehydratase